MLSYSGFAGLSVVVCQFQWVGIFSDPNLADCDRLATSKIEYVLKVRLCVSTSTVVVSEVVEFYSAEFCAMHEWF